jgi:hypothetical protein
MSSQPTRTSGPLATQYVQGIYIPAGLLIFGTFIIKKEWLLYSVALAAVLGTWKVWMNRKSIPSQAGHYSISNSVLQEFPRSSNQMSSKNSSSRRRLSCLTTRQCISSLNESTSRPLITCNQLPFCPPTATRHSRPPYWPAHLPRR